MQLAAAPACGGGAVWGAEEGGGGQGRGGEGVLGQEQRGLLVYLGGEKKMNLMEAKKKINLMEENTSRLKTFTFAARETGVSA